MSALVPGSGDEIRQRAEAWMGAAFRPDVAACRDILAAEFTMVTNRGSEIGRDEWLDNIARRITGAPPAFLDARVQVYGDVALMTSRNLLRATFDGADWSGELYLTDVWVRRDGRWQVVR